MKNKKILSIFFIIFSVILINRSIGEEIIFETPEIKSFENGNLLIADKGGKAVIDKSTEIIADKFEYNKTTDILIAKGNAQGIDYLNEVIITGDELVYNKIKLIFTAKGNATAIDKLNKTTIEADELEYNKKDSKYTATKNVKVDDVLNNTITKAEKIIYLTNQEKIFTEGKTRIFFEEEYTINSYDVVWLRKKNEFSSEKYTTFKDTDNNFYTAEKFRYFADKKLFRGNKATLESPDENEYKFEDVFINVKTNELHGKDLNVNFYNKMFGNKENEPRLKGNKAYSNKEITRVSKGVFTTCKRRPNGKCPPWRVEAQKAKHDKKKKTIYYKNAWLKIYDVPVWYYPYFFHPDPTVKRQTGFLIPEIGESHNLGPSAYIPYFYVISDTKDLTFKPRIFVDKLSLQTEYRKATKKSQHIFDVSLTAGHNSSESDKSDTRSHFFSNSMIDLDMSFFDISNLKIQLQRTSNNTYLKLFELESPLFGNNRISSDVSSLSSFVDLTAHKKDLDFSASIKINENLDASNSDRYEFIFPSYALNKIINTNDALNGNLSFNSSGSYHLFNTNVKEAQIINDLLYASEDLFLLNGIKNNYNILIKNVNTDGENSSSYKSELESELLSTAIFASSYPMLREGLNFNSYLSPKLSLMYSPNHMKNKKNDKTRIGINNIYSLNRVASSDTIESGQSLTLGIDYKHSRNLTSLKYIDKNLPKDILEINLASVFRDEINEDIPILSTIGNKSSDLFGRIKIKPYNFFSSDYNFSLDNSLDKIKYSRINAEFKVNNFLTSFKYIEENDDIGNQHYIANRTTYNFDKNNSIEFTTRRNKKINITEFYNLIYQYQNDCLTAAVKYKKEYYEDNDLKPEEQLFFSLTIVPLGAWESKNIIHQYETGKW